MNASLRVPTVLVVDDEVRSQDAMRRTLEEDFTVLTASAPTTRPSRRPTMSGHNNNKRNLDEAAPRPAVCYLGLPGNPGLVPRQQQAS